MNSWGRSLRKEYWVDTGSASGLCPGSPGHHQVLLGEEEAQRQAIPSLCEALWVGLRSSVSDEGRATESLRLTPLNWSGLIVNIKSDKNMSLSCRKKCNQNQPTYLQGRKKMP